ncbi:PQQ-binding-like beta-propeller repeat protein [Acidianus infernus]|uniref:PQQ-binding-like beta-propeller repeat protein n=1 Tax=Acidianus infernus TaxID=12915 RepID=A0A6A9QDU5_ACIIN|nr:PQQ-binding-like beta-propeller repeat protein [Acidianus infernus]MUM64294.1 PQQ-binding-like beta-propeller repeat protein [Acidianus infernus]
MPTPEDKDMVIFDNGDGNVYVLNATNGQLIWNYGSANIASLGREQLCISNNCIFSRISS